MGLGGETLEGVRAYTPTSTTHYLTPCVMYKILYSIRARDINPEESRGTL